ncbi:hypothetical protein GCM10009839_43630 [Catenulispora yoronensis]|uniref:Uncharacterized protein n=1 Tax=Catenulispora yoronensis TaxID=450799 RepID=A0ABN2UPE7_9ACTN
MDTARHQDTKRPARTQAARRSAAAILLAAGCTLLPVPAAHAVDATTCTGTSSVSYSPGLTLTSQTVTLAETDTFTSCTSTDPTITGLPTSPYTYPIPNASCNSVQYAAGNTLVPHWNNGQTSTISGVTYTTTNTAGITQTLGTGTITAGEFTGDIAVISWSYPLVNPLLCLLPGGLASQNGTIIFEVTG